MPGLLVTKMATQEYAGFRVVVCGDSGTGKTSIVAAMNGADFDPAPKLTIGYELSIVTRRIDILIGDDDAPAPVPKQSVNIKLLLNDISGTDRLASFMSSIFRDAHALVVVYDICNMESFEHLITWIKKALGVRSKFDPYVFVVGNKLDMAELHRAVRREDVREMCEPRGYCFLELSAKDRTNVPLFIDTLCAELYRQFGRTLGESRGSGIRVPVPMALSSLPAPKFSPRDSPGRAAAAAPAVDSPGRTFIKLGIRDPAEMVGNPTTPRGPLKSGEQWVLRLRHTPDTIVHDDSVNVADRPVDLRAPPSKPAWSCFGGWFSKSI